jgi:hypothetical protein
VWYNLLLGYRLHRFTPTADDDFAIWWDKLASAVPHCNRKEINTLVVLVTRSPWLERNSRVFDKFATMPVEVCRKIRVELEQ